MWWEHFSFVSALLGKGLGELNPAFLWTTVDVGIEISLGQASRSLTPALMECPEGTRSLRKSRQKKGFIPKHTWDISGLSNEWEDIEETDICMEKARLEPEKHFLGDCYLDPIFSFWLMWPEKQELELSPTNTPCFFNLSQAKLYIVVCFVFDMTEPPT